MWLDFAFERLFGLKYVCGRLPLIIIYSVSTIGSTGGGWLPGLFRGIGLSTSSARLAAMLCCALLVVPIGTIGTVKTIWIAIALLSIAAGAHQGWSANLFTTSSDMFPRSVVSSVVGVGSMAGAIGSALFAFFAGHVLQLTHSYATLFGIAVSAYLLALVILRLLAPRLKPAGVIA
jgi:ACS family hexuronate transporter-like MFS transporter